MNSEKVNSGAEIVHRAVQLLTKSGKSWLEERPDDSHTNAAYGKGVFSGRELLPQMYLAIEILPLRLLLMKGDEVLWQTNLSGRKHLDIEMEMVEKLSEHGLDLGRWQADLHYELPYRQLSEYQYPEGIDEELRAFAEVRDFGVECLENFQDQLGEDLGLRTWPHHFDHGGLMIVDSDADGNLRETIGIGLAMHDSLIPEHYFYVSHWKKEGNIDYPELPELPSGGSWIGNQPMAVLPVCQLKRENKFSSREALDFLHLAVKTSKSFLL